MTPAFSIYLDLVRIVAAFLVLLAHTNLRVLTDRVPRGSGFGHSAVVVFFVLSGYVIAYIVDKREGDPRVYAISRISRIYSVMVPALLLTIALDTLGRNMAPAIYAGQTTEGWWAVRLFATLALMNEPWGISIQAFSGPFWSVAYEGWYYILFGLYTFWHRSWRSVVLAVALLICGPKVLLLFPIWLAGVYLHRGRVWTRLTPALAVPLFALSVLSIVLYHWLEGPQQLREVIGDAVGRPFQNDRMTWSGEFLGDYLLGFMVMVNFAAFRAAGPLLAGFVLPFAKPIRWAASFTFSLYLFHRPLILFYVACLRGDPRSGVFYFGVVALTLISVYGLGLATEHRKEWFKQLTEKCLRAVETIIVRLGPVAT